jgi:hypothetical protein
MPERQSTRSLISTPCQEGATLNHRRLRIPEHQSAIFCPKTKRALLRKAGLHFIVDFVSQKMQLQYYNTV